jgi:hypothetical protein
MADNESALARVLDAAFQIIGSGAGAAIGLVTGNPGLVIGGAMAGQAFASISTDVASRALSHREQARVGAVIEYTVRAIQGAEAAGRSIRDDGFFDGDRSDFTEVAEGVLLAAKSSYEEAKLPYMARALAQIAIDKDIDKTMASYIVQIGESLTWMEMQILSIVGRPEDFPMPDHDMHRAAGDWPTYIVLRAYETLHAESRQLLVSPTIRRGSVILDSWDLSMKGQILSSQGQLMVESMGLKDVPADQLTAVYERLTAPPV